MFCESTVKLATKQCQNTLVEIREFTAHMVSSVAVNLTLWLCLTSGLFDTEQFMSSVFGL